MKGDALESGVKEAVRKLLDSLGPACHYRMPVRTRFGRQHLDFEGCIGGKFFAIETKREGGGRLTASQCQTMNEITAAGGLTWVEDSRDLEKTRCVLRSQFGIRVEPTASSEKTRSPTA